LFCREILVISQQLLINIVVNYERGHFTHSERRAVYFLYFDSEKFSEKVGKFGLSVIGLLFSVVAFVYLAGDP